MHFLLKCLLAIKTPRVFKFIILSMLHFQTVSYSLAMEIYEEDQLTEYEIIRQRNIIANYEFMKSCGES